MRNAPWARSSYWMYTILINEDEFGAGSREILRKLNSKKIQSRPLWQPIHRSPAYASMGTLDLPVAERLETGLEFALFGRAFGGRPGESHHCAHAVVLCSSFQRRGSCRGTKVLSRCVPRGPLQDLICEFGGPSP